MSIPLRPIGTRVAILLALLVPPSEARQTTIPGFIKEPNGRFWLGYEQIDFPGGLDEFHLTFLGDASQNGVTAAPAYRLRRVPSWRLSFHTSGSDVTFNASNLDSTQGALSVTSSTSHMEAFWDNVRRPGDTGTFDLRLIFDIAAQDKVATVNVVVDASLYNSGWTLASVDAPLIEVLSLDVNQPPAAAERLVLPVEEGVIIHSPLDKSPGRYLTTTQVLNQFPGKITMQWLAFYSEDTHGQPYPPAVVFAGSRDPNGFTKRYTIAADVDAGPGTTPYLRFLPGHRPTDEYNARTYDSTTTYPSVIGLLRGGWYEAARFYRSWAIQQPFCAGGPMRSNPQFSATIRSAPIFATYNLDHGQTAGNPGIDCNNQQCSTTCLQHAVYSNFQYWSDRLQETYTLLDINLMPVHLYSWDDESFAGYSGDWLPMRPEFVNEAQTLGTAHPFAPYFRLESYDVAQPTYANGGGVLDFNGTPLYPGINLSLYNLASAPGVPLAAGTGTVCDPSVIGACNCVSTTRICKATPFARDYASYFARLLQTGAGATGIYLDEFNQFPSEPCFNNATAGTFIHDHRDPNAPGGVNPVGGGDWYTRNQRRLLQRLRTEMRVVNQASYVMNEVQNEMYVDLIELNLFRAAPAGAFLVDPAVKDTYNVPTYQTVYHDRTRSTVVTTAVYPSTYTDASGTVVGGLINGFDGQVAQRYVTCAAVSQGASPWFSTLLGPQSITSLMAAFPEFAGTVLLYRNLMDVIDQPPVHAHVALGELLRAPPTNSPTVDLSAYAPFAPAPTSNFFMSGVTFRPGGPVQPFVFASAYGNGQPNRLGVLLLNWTDDSMATANPMFFSGAGTRTVAVTIDPVSYGLAPGTYDLHRYFAGGGTPQASTINIGSAPVTFNATVGERSAVFAELKHQ